jgi:hypothetical protein
VDFTIIAPFKKSITILRPPSIFKKEENPKLQRTKNGQKLFSPKLLQLYKLKISENATT